MSAAVRVVLDLAEMGEKFCMTKQDVKDAITRLSPVQLRTLQRNLRTVHLLVQDRRGEVIKANQPKYKQKEKL